ncbi:CesT family type III secretion system chaperone [Caenimonas koreensis]|uniref:Tir chaperone protein (CesT) family protein n=1 Tax=Caenimonas koreensis DSM 17982 TaxID=1121255 RepID=A0A844AWI9_9BURK|nr:CesT family type III secretion system chaperone [Caenimonas koreensis]MRD48880.1 hypothetical protein [Caenimonas koreensis DSM 17982]
MFSPSSPSQLVSALSDALGQPVGIDDGDECVIEFDGDVQVVLAQTASAQVLSLRSDISAAGAADPRLMQWALELNYTSMLPGCAIASDDAAQQLVLVALVDADFVSSDQLLSLLAGFVQLVPQLREQYETLVREGAPPAAYMGAFT